MTDIIGFTQSREAGLTLCGFIMRTLLISICALRSQHVIPKFNKISYSYKELQYLTGILVAQLGRAITQFFLGI